VKCAGNIFNSGLTSPRFGCTCPNCEHARKLKGYSIKPDDLELYLTFLIYVAALAGQKLPRNTLLIQKKSWIRDLADVKAFLARYDMNL
jgi:hypothetical protein